VTYLCLGYYDEAAFDRLTPEEINALVRSCKPLDDELHASGALLTVASLEHRVAVTIRTRGGKASVTDGPFIESKEQIGSYFLVEARDMNDAIRIASLHPAARLGEDLGWAVEIRAIERVVKG